MQWTGISADQVFYGVTMAMLLMVFTLPQSILLWTEPDMEEAG